jgi:hypothetical protein
MPEIIYFCGMPVKWRKSIAIFVLFSFIALLTKALWHDCTHREHLKTPHSSEKSNHSFEQGAEKCYACDLHIPLLSNPVSAQHPFAQFFVSGKIVIVSNAGQFGIVEIETLRGPPSGMI